MLDCDPVAAPRASLLYAFFVHKTMPIQIVPEIGTFGNVFFVKSVIFCEFFVEWPDYCPDINAANSSWFFSALIFSMDAPFTEV